MELFCCPACGSPLVRCGGALICKKHHSYDTAREGYVHLLPAQRMHAKIPGDSKEMVAARRSFLQAGYYSLFAEALCRLLAGQLAGIAAPIVVDAGCGEGYYTAQFARHLAQQGLQPQIAAFDISKFAVRAAAKQGAPHTAFAVASSFAIPLPSGCADALVNVFSPVAAEEFCRVLKPGGVLVYAVPGPRHLFGLKEILYETPYENPVQDIHYTGFVQEQRTEVCGRIAVEQEQLHNLFAMTPYYWKTPQAGTQRLRETRQLETEICFHFLLYRRL